MKKLYKNFNIIFGVMLVLLLIVGYAWFSAQSKVSFLEREKMEINAQITILQTELESESESGEDEIKYKKMLLRGWESLADAQTNRGYAESDYDDASVYYDENYFTIAKSFADSCDIYYAYASGDFSDAEGMFDEAEKYAQNDDDLRLAELLSDFSGCMETIFSEMHEACEYFSSACDSYSKEYWSQGDDQIEEMNKHIISHDDLVPTCLQHWSETNALVESY